MTDEQLAEKNAQFAKGVMELAFRMGYVTRDSELIRCEECARNKTCFTHRQTNENGYCAWAERKEDD